MGSCLQMQLPTHPANLYPNVKIKDRQLVEEKESSYQLNQQSNFDKGQSKGTASTWTRWPILDKRSRSV